MVEDGYGETLFSREKAKRITRTETTTRKKKAQQHNTLTVYT